MSHVPWVAGLLMVSTKPRPLLYTRAFRARWDDEKRSTIRSFHLSRRYEPN
jgi:hypothetical protein